MLKFFTTLITLAGALCVWVFLSGYYTLAPGESAVILRLGAYARTVTLEGPHLHLPWPLESRDVVESNRELRLDFGDVDDAARRAETAMQTRDNNIVYLEFTVLYRRSDPFETLYRVRDMRTMLSEASQAAMREVVGKSTVDGVLRDRREWVESEVQELLQQISDRYLLGVSISDVVLQEVQPPGPVRAAFDDVINASQDRNRKINEAEGYANEVLPQARAEAAERRTAAVAYRDAKVAQAEGESTRFSALLEEYRQAPQVTRKRLYLETMEEVLPGVEKVIIEPGGTPVLPYLPLGAGSRPPAPAPASNDAPGGASSTAGDAAGGAPRPGGGTSGGGTTPGGTSGEGAR